jgi:uncharacterized protein
MAELQNHISLIGREIESNKMRGFLLSPESELLAIIGRRRVGKTFLIKRVYKEEMVFHITGLQDVSRSMQLDNFIEARNQFFPESIAYAKPKTWLVAFSQLKQLLGKPRKKRGSCFLMNFHG